MFIYVGCAGGGTSSLFCQRIVKEITAQDANLKAVYDDVATVSEKRLAYGAHYDLVFAYGGAAAIRDYTAFEFGKLFDVVYVAPQVRFLTEGIRQSLQRYPTIVKDIPMKIFGRMDGKQAYRDLLTDLILLDDLRGSQSGQGFDTKAQDKNLELLLIGGDQQGALFKGILAYFEKLGVELLVEPFSLSQLYRDDYPDDFEVRFLNGGLEDLNQRDFPRMARRIDGVIFLSLTQQLSQLQRQWLRDYRMPVLMIAAKAVALQDITGISEAIREFLVTVQWFGEASSDIAHDYLEYEKLPVRKTFLKIFSWEV